MRWAGCFTTRLTVLVLITLALMQTTVPAAGQAALIIDHRCTNIAAIPPEWIEQAKLLTLHYAHTSHGSQVVDGALTLESLDAIYSIAVRTSGTAGLPPIESLPALRVYDGNPPETYISPDDYWQGEAALNRTRAVAQTGHYNFSMWSWCGEQSWYSAAATAQYLAALTQLESEFPAMRFILMTGHTDGTGVEGNLNQRNQQIRAYARDHAMVLFDFADIESYDPDWTGYLALYCTDYGSYSGGDWPAEWCAAHPGDPLCTACSCAHSQALICNLKGRAFWWLMARLAGWPGTDPADIDWDGDVDAADWLRWAACAASPDAQPAPPGGAVEECREAFDADEDGDVDLVDFERFQSVYSG